MAKKPNPNSILDYRPLACCNVIYKCLTNILSLRLKHILGNIISSNQSSFISGRTIQDNVLLAHELLRNYHKTTGSSRYALKIDLKNAYDTVIWRAGSLLYKNLVFLRSSLSGLDDVFLLLDFLL